MVKNLRIETITVHAAKYPNVFRRPYGALVEGKSSTTIPISDAGNRIRVEISNIQHIRSTAQANGVGEIPLNGKGMAAIYDAVKK